MKLQFIIGPFTLAKPKSKIPGFFVVPFTLPEKPITFWLFGKKSACAKTPEYHTVWFFGKWCACATSLYLWPYVVCSTSRATATELETGHGGWFCRRSRPHVTKNPNNTGERVRASVYIGKKPVKNRRSFKKPHFGGGFFDSVFLQCLGVVA